MDGGVRKWEGGKGVGVGVHTAVGDTVDDISRVPCLLRKRVPD